MHSKDGVPLHGHVLAVDGRGVQRGGVGAARGAEVGVALAHAEVARALLRVALRLAAAPREPVLTCERAGRARGLLTLPSSAVGQLLQLY